MKRFQWIGFVFACALMLNSTAAAQAGVAAQPPGTLEFVATNLVSTAKGRFHEWSVVDSAVDIAALEDAFVVVTVVLASLDTGNDRRDEHLRNPDFFDVEKFPTATVRVHSPKRIEVEASEKPHYVAQFDLDLHGVKKTVEGEIVLLGTSPVAFEGNVLIDRLDFEVGEKPSFWNPMAPKAEIAVRFHVEL